MEVGLPPTKTAGYAPAVAPAPKPGYAPAPASNGCKAPPSSYTPASAPSTPNKTVGKQTHGLTDKIIFRVHFAPKSYS